MRSLYRRLVRFWPVGAFAILAPALVTLAAYFFSTDLAIFITTPFLIIIAALIQNRIKNREREKLREPDPQKLDGDKSFRSIFRLLREEHRIVDFDFRERTSELKKLIDWMEKPPRNVSVFLLYGNPGQGKSRLARELYSMTPKNDKDDDPRQGKFQLTQENQLAREKLCERFKKRWDAIFISEEDKEGDWGNLFLGKPLLVVIDAAERRREQVREIIKDALRNGNDGASVCILLITRSREWWTALTNELGGYFPDDLSEESNIKLEPLKNREHAFECALECFEKELEKDYLKEALKALGVSLDEGKKAEMDRSIPSELQKEEVQVLEIHMVALLAALRPYNANDSGNAGRAKGKSDLSEKGLLKQLVEWEKKSWQRVIEISDLGEDAQGNEVQRVVAWLGATDSNTEDFGLSERLALLPIFRGEDGTEERVRLSVAKSVQTLYPASDSSSKEWGGIRPDRIATYLAGDLTDMIKKETESKEPGSVASLSEDALRNLLRHFTRRVEQHYDLDVDEEVLANAIRAGGENAFIAVTELVKEESTIASILDKLAAKVLREIADKNPKKALTFAYRLDDVANDQPPYQWSELGCTAAQLIYEDARDVSGQEPLKKKQEFLVQCATSVSWLNRCLAARKQPEIEFLIESVNTCLKLVDLAENEGDDKYNSDHLLATSFTDMSLGISLAREERIPMPEELMELELPLMEKAMDKFEKLGNVGGMASCSFNLYWLFSARNRHEDGLSWINRAVTLYRKLLDEEKEEDEYRRMFFMSLWERLDCLSVLNRPVQKVRQVAEDTCRELNKRGYDKDFPEEMERIRRYYEQLRCSND